MTQLDVNALNLIRDVSFEIVEHSARGIFHCAVCVISPLLAIAVSLFYLPQASTLEYLLFCLVFICYVDNTLLVKD
jgi:hypothetical protein